MVSRILGPDGQPIAVEDLQEPQTSRLLQLQNEFQNHPSRGLTPSRLASILEQAEQGDILGQYELFEDMEEKDGHIAAEMGKRRRAVAQLPWDIVAPTSALKAEKDAAEELKALVAEIPDIDGVIYDITDAVGKGFANLEIEWHRIDGTWLPKTVTHRPQGWFKLHRGFRQEIRLRDLSADGAPLQPFGWVSHVHKAKSGYLERSSLFRALVWPYLFKNYSVGDLAEFLEIYGIPLRLGKYPPGASEKEKVTLLRALVSLGHNAAGIVPAGMELDFKDAATGDPDAFELMIDWCERTESKLILGATLTSQADRGSNTNALGNVHNDVRIDLRDGDARQIAATITRDLVYPIGVLNGLIKPNMRRAPKFKLDTSEPEDIKIYADALPSLVKIGFKIPRPWAQQKVGVPEPEDGEDVLGTSAEAPTTDLEIPDDPKAVHEPVPKKTAAATARSRAALDPPGAMAARLNRLPGGAAAWVEQIRDLVNNADSLEAIRDGLLQLFPDMGLDEYAAAMGQALAAARLAGRVEVLDDIEQLEADGGDAG